EYEVKDIKLDQKLTIKPEVFEKKMSYPGIITKISRVSQVSKNTSENILQVEVKPTEKIPHIVPGFKVSARIYLNDEEPGIIIPSTSLLFDDTDYFIYISNENGNIQKRTIEFKDLKGDKIIITKGLSQGEIFIINPNDNLKSGDTIEITISENSNESSQRKGKKT
ncbi:MAG: efflux RND transporter periplasmic adaptor subunit, partial [Cetobacterium sp.]